MIDINLKQEPNQQTSIELDGSSYDITVKTTTTLTVVTIVRDGVTIIDSVRAMPLLPILPYRYQEAGNFSFITENDELPYYENFGVSQFLVYLTPDELVELRA